MIQLSTLIFLFRTYNEIK